ncbi:MAG: N-acetylglutaminylglutamine synthetase [Pseudomonadota bacterium]
MAAAQKQPKPEPASAQNDNWDELLNVDNHPGMTPDAIVDCGWGNLIFGQTFSDSAYLAETIRHEQAGQRDVALYVREPHVVLAHAPHALFLDPSHTFRLDLTKGDLKKSDARASSGIRIRSARPTDEKTINAIYLARGMVPVRTGFFADRATPDCVKCLIAEDLEGTPQGVVMGVDHFEAFGDPRGGSSLWSLAVDIQAKIPGVGSDLITELAAGFRRNGRNFMDLSVMYDNDDALALYRKLGFQQVPVFCVKKKNPINEKLFVGPQVSEELNIYAQIIVDEARRRGITVEVEDADTGLFTLSLGGRRISCRESLSDLTSAVAMSRCDDKTLTHRLLKAAGIRVPAQLTVKKEEDAIAFLEREGSIVVKPARGEQGSGVFVDITSGLEVRAAVAHAKKLCETVILETYVTGDDLRVIVIGGEMVAAAIRKPAGIVGDGQHTIKELIEKQSRRRAAATRGESRIPVDSETERCVHTAGFHMSDVLEKGRTLAVRKTANLHTGGTIHDVTEIVHPELRDAAIAAARVLQMPVAGMDLIVPDVTKPDYVIIEANERPGLANHEPAPTAEKFIDLLFPQTKPNTKPQKPQPTD